MSDNPSEPIPAVDAAPVEPEASQKRAFSGLTPAERRTRQQDLEWAVSPGFDFFLFSLAGGLLLIPAILFDSAALYLLAALFVPFLGPMVGLGLAAPTNSLRMFGRSLASVALSGMFFFAAGAGAGLMSGLWPGLAFEQAAYHASFNWPDLLVLAVGALFAVYSLIRSPRRRPLIANVALGYELFLPAGVAGFGLTGGVAGLWPDAIIVFGVHLVFVVLLAMLALWSAGFHPRGAVGATLFVVFLALSLGSGTLLSGFTSAARIPGWPLVAAQPSPEISPPAATTGSTDVVTGTTAAATSPSVTEAKATATGTPPATAQPTLTPQPTPYPALIAARDGDGAFIRREPDSSSRVLTSILNGNRVWILSTPVLTGDTAWVQVRTEAGLEGWIVQDLLNPE